MSATCCRKISLWTRTTSWARKSPNFSQSDDESSKSETSMVIRGRNTVGCRMPHPYLQWLLSSPTAVGFYGSAMPLLIRLIDCLPVHNLDDDRSTTTGHDATDCGLAQKS
jgi:hypothetical protein